MTDPQPPHDHDDPQSYLNALEMAVYEATTIRCVHCHATGKMLPMSGAAWGIEVFHEDDCPEHEDNQPPPVRPRQ